MSDSIFKLSAEDKSRSHQDQTNPSLTRYLQVRVCRPSLKVVKCRKLKIILPLLPEHLNLRHQNCKNSIVPVFFRDLTRQHVAQQRVIRACRRFALLFIFLDALIFRKNRQNFENSTNLEQLTSLEYLKTSENRQQEAQQCYNLFRQLSPGNGSEMKKIRLKFSSKTLAT